MDEPLPLGALDGVLTGGLAPFQGRLSIGPFEPTPGVRNVSTSELMTPAHLQLVRRHFDAAHGVTSARVVASIWSKWHFAIVMPAWFIGRVVLRRKLPMTLDVVSFDVSDEGRTMSLRLPHAGPMLEDASTEDALWPDLMAAHLVPFVEQLAERTGVTRRVLWSNAGNLFESFIQRLDEVHPDLPGLGPARQLLEIAEGPDGQPNPMFQPVTYLPRAGGQQRMRRICCMRYLVPDRVFCTTCPSPLLNASNNACTPVVAAAVPKIST